MKTPLEILKECREQLIPKPIVMNESLESLKNILEEDINEALIQQIRLYPSIDFWTIRLPVKSSYLTPIPEINHIKMLLRFIREIVEKPNGFELDGAITHLDVFNEIGIRFKEVV